jgi:hypothetical protein
MELCPAGSLMKRDAKGRAGFNPPVFTPDRRMPRKSSLIKSGDCTVMAHSDE